MTPEQQRRLSEFVDRRAEMSQFGEMLDGKGKRVFVIWGEEGLGKSSLLERMRHETSLRQLPKAEVTWTKTRNYDYLGIMRKVRDDLGAAAFNAFTDLVNYYTVNHYTLKVEVQGNITVAQGLQVQNATVGDIAGVIVKDAMFVGARADQLVSETEKMLQLTRRFVDCLAQVTATRPAVLFFDEMELMTASTNSWIWDELIGALRDGRLVNVYCVLCGKNEPTIDRDLELHVEARQLSPLELEDILEYLEKRGMDEPSRLPIARLALLETEGQPLKVASLVDRYMKKYKVIGRQ